MNSHCHLLVPVKMY